VYQSAVGWADWLPMQEEGSGEGAGFMMVDGISELQLDG
jgi:hypothetical protein